MTKKTNINKDESIYFHQANNFNKSKRDNKKEINRRDDNNIPLCYSHGGESNICSYTSSETLHHPASPQPKSGNH